MKKNQTFIFGETIIEVLSEFDTSSGRYILDLPDLEENQIFTNDGEPLVTAVQDCCTYIDDAFDCGSCRFYKPNHPGDLIGICSNPQNKK